MTECVDCVSRCPAYVSLALLMLVRGTDVGTAQQKQHPFKADNFEQFQEKAMKRCGEFTERGLVTLTGGKGTASRA